jgi:hypothetical protein
MNVKEARRLWGSEVPQDILEEWVRVCNLQRATVANDDPEIPKGATIEVSLGEPQELRGVSSDHTHDVRHG